MKENHENLLTFPMAKRPLSKKNSTPRNRKNTPNPDTPMPISATQKPPIKLLKTQAKKKLKASENAYFGNLLWETFSETFV